MALKTDFKNSIYSGLKKFKSTDNGDGSQD